MRLGKSISARSALVMAALVFGAGPSPAQTPADAGTEPPEMSLAAAVGLALRNSRAVKTALITSEADEFALKLAESGFDVKWSVDAETALTRTRQSANELASQASTKTYTASLTPKAELENRFGTSFTLQFKNSFQHVTDNIANSGERQFTVNPELTIVQPLLRGFGEGVNGAALEIARLNARLNRMSLKNTVARTVTSVVKEYWQVVLSKEQLSIDRAALERARQTLETDRNLVEAGRMAAADLIQAEAEVAQNEYDLDVAENNYRAAKNAFTALLDLPRTADFTPSSVGGVEQIDIPLETVYALTETGKFEIVQAEISRALAKIAVITAEDGRLWRLDLTGTASAGNARESLSNAAKDVPAGGSTLSVKLNLSVPINDLAPESAAISAKADLTSADLDLEEVRQTVRLDAQNNVREAAARHRQLQLAENATRLAERQLEAEQEKLEAGRSSNFQVLTYQDSLRTAQVNEISARVNYLTALADLDLFMGTVLETWSIELTDGAADMTEDEPRSLRRLAVPPGLGSEAPLPDPEGRQGAEPVP